MGRKTAELKIKCFFNENGDPLWEIVCRSLRKFLQEELGKNVG